MRERMENRRVRRANWKERNIVLEKRISGRINRVVLSWQHGRAISARPNALVISSCHSNSRGNAKTDKGKVETRVEALVEQYQLQPRHRMTSDSRISRFFYFKFYFKERDEIGWEKRSNFISWKRSSFVLQYMSTKM